MITSDVIARKCYPFVVDNVVFHASQDSNKLVYKEEVFNKYVANNVRRHLTCRISDSSVIGNNSEVREKSIID